MWEYTESYPTICIGRILAYCLYGGPQDHCRRVFDVHSDNQSNRLGSRVWRVQKGHTVTHNKRPQSHFFTFLLILHKTVVAVTKIFHGCTDQSFTLSGVTLHAKHANLNCL